MKRLVDYLNARFPDYFRQEPEIFWNTNLATIKSLIEYCDDLAEKLEELEKRMDADPEVVSQEIMKSTIEDEESDVPVLD